MRSKWIVFVRASDLLALLRSIDAKLDALIASRDDQRELEARAREIRTTNAALNKAVDQLPEGD